MIVQISNYTAKKYFIYLRMFLWLQEFKRKQHHGKYIKCSNVFSIFAVMRWEKKWAKMKMTHRWCVGVNSGMTGVSNHVLAASTAFPIGKSITGKQRKRPTFDRFQYVPFFIRSESPQDQNEHRLVLNLKDTDTYVCM